MLVIAGVLVWLTYKGLTSPGGMVAWRVYLQLAGAVACFVLAMIGVRQRHRDGEGRP